MTEDKKKTAFSRRSLLFGSFLKKDAAWEPKPPVAQAQAGASILAQANQAYDSGDWEGASAHYRDYLAVDGSNLEARRRLGLSFYRLAKYIQAKVEFERVLHQSQKDPFSLLYLGLTLARLGYAQKAAVVWRLHFDPKNVPVQRELNLQIALLESDSPPTGEDMAAAVERAIGQSRPKA